MEGAPTHYPLSEVATCLGEIAVERGSKKSQGKVLALTPDGRRVPGA